MDNYFTLFDMPVSFLPDKDKLRKKFFELSKEHHPDRFTLEGEEKKDASLEVSANINKAYRIFNNPDATLNYVLTLKGLLEAEEKYNLAPTFLARMMEVNEEVAEANLGDDPVAKETSLQQLKNLEKELYAPVAPIIENYVDGVTTDEELLQVKDYYFKKKYLNRIYDALGGML